MRHGESRVERLTEAELERKQQVAEFIERWITDNGRWNSPKFLAGESFIEEARGAGILAGIPISDDYPLLGGDAILVAVTEKRTRAEIERYRDIAAGKGGAL